MVRCSRIIARDRLRGPGPGDVRGGNPPMRRGIVTILSATAVTSAVVAMAGFAAPAYASPTLPGKAHLGQSLPVVATDSFAGYEDSGRDFRFIHAVISVPNQPAP